MTRLSPRTIARRQFEYAASKARQAELAATVRAGLPSAPPPDEHSRLAWAAWTLAYRSYIDGLKWTEKKLLAEVLNREMVAVGK